MRMRSDFYEWLKAFRYYGGVEPKICARITKRIQRWNCWRKPCLNSKAYKLAVLLGLAKSMTFELTATDEEYEEYRREMEQILTEGRESEK